VRKACPPPTASPAFQTDCAGARHGDICLGRCSPGYTGSPKQLECDDGMLLGDLPNCTGLICSLEGISIGVGVTAEACVGITTSSSCELGCTRGFEGSGSGTLNCGIDGSFNTTGAFECRPKQCFPLSSISPFSEPHFADSCANKEFGDICTAFCEPGWEIGGNATVMLCDDTPLSSAGFAEYVGRIPAENSSGPVCTAKPCTIGLPNLRGTSSDCSGKATLETCTVTALPGFTMTDSVLTCLPDSSFNGTISEVVESSCPDRAQVTGYASTCQDKKPGDECWVYCETGYTGNPAPYMCDADTLTFVAKDANASCVGSGGRRLSGSGGCQAAAAAAFGLSDPQFTHDCSSGSGVADGSICIAHCSRGYELVGVASVLTCNSGSLSGTLPVCTPLPCTYNGPDAVGLQHNCSNVTPLEGTSLRSFGCADCFCNFRHQSSYRGITSASFALKYNMTTAVVNASESGTCFQREGHVSGLAEVHTSSVVFFLASFSSGNRKG
ncbi:SELP, partial [Symbiodinium sp. KB8]